jgi:hypothetical protein
VALWAVIGAASLASARPQGVLPGGCVVPIPASKTGWVPKHLWKPFKQAVATRAAAAMGLLDRQGRPDPSKVQVYTSGWSRGLSKDLHANDSGQYRGGHIIQAAHKASKVGHDYKVKGVYYAYQSRQGHIEVFPVALTGTPEGATKGKHVQNVDTEQPYHGTYAYAEHTMPAQKTVQLVKARNTALAIAHRQPGQDGANILGSAFNPAARTTTYVVHGQPTQSTEARDPRAVSTVSLFKNRFILQSRGILPGGCVVNPTGDSTVRTKFLDQVRPVICPVPMPPVRPLAGNQ